jgi:hypothetical protein
MQALHIKAAARQHPGGTILVVIGYAHKGDIEHVLGGTPGIVIVQPSVFGYPTPAEVNAATRREDLFAILSFNLLGVQPWDGAVNWGWLDRLLDRLGQVEATAETLLLQTRFAVLRSQLTPDEALVRYERAWALPGTGDHFTFDGVVDRRRLDSYYDPFGNLTVGERTLLEQSREHHKAGHTADAQRLRDEMAGATRFSELQWHQLAGYWNEYVLSRP